MTDALVVIGVLVNTALLCAIHYRLGSLAARVNFLEIKTGLGPANLEG